MGKSSNGTVATTKRGKKNRKPSLAERADKFECYQKSVQSPDHEIEFFEQAYRDVFDRKPRSLREDFCGTFAICCSWVKSNSKRKATGVDLCPETLQWGRDHNLSRLKDSQADRIQLLEQDVRTSEQPTVDILAAQNFSFWIFKTRKEVIEYFKVARSNLNSDGVMTTRAILTNGGLRKASEDSNTTGNKPGSTPSMATPVSTSASSSMTGAR